MRMSSCRVSSVMVTPPTGTAPLLTRLFRGIGDPLSDTALVRGRNLVFRLIPPKLDGESLVLYSITIYKSQRVPESVESSWLRL